MRVLTAVLLLFVATAQAENLGAGLKKCAAINDSLQRLVCYDSLAKRAEGLSARYDHAAAGRVGIQRHAAFKARGRLGPLPSDHEEGHAVQAER